MSRNDNSDSTLGVVAAEALDAISQTSSESDISSWVLITMVSINRPKNISLPLSFLSAYYPRAIE